MKIFKFIWLLFILSVPLAANAQSSVALIVKDGVDESIKQVIEKNSSLLLTRINSCYNTKDKGLDLTGINMTQQAKESLSLTVMMLRWLRVV